MPDETPSSTAQPSAEPAQAAQPSAEPAQAAQPSAEIKPVQPPTQPGSKPAKAPAAKKPATKPATPPVPYEAVVAMPQGQALNVRNGPGEKHPVLLILYAGTTVTVVGVKNGWCNLRNGGWASGRYLKPR